MDVPVKEGVCVSVPDRVPEMVDIPVMELVMVCDPVRVFVGLTESVPVTVCVPVPVPVKEGV